MKLEYINIKPGEGHETKGNGYIDRTDLQPDGSLNVLVVEHDDISFDGFDEEEKMSEVSDLQSESEE